MALLHAAARSAKDEGWRVIALHVHHGLSPNADAWWSHVEQQCLRWSRRGLSVDFIGRRLTDRPGAAESVEAWARAARYEALARMAKEQGASIVLLAHHRRDQAETLLLQALRGAGTAGLSAMPASIERDGLTWARPWLAMPREAVEAYVRRHRIRHVEDESNADVRFARNRLRHAVWPVLGEAFPQAESALAQSAEWAQQATACLLELGGIDLAVVAPDGPLMLGPWQALSSARRSNALRLWLQRALGRPAAASWVARLLDEAPQGSNGAGWQVDRLTLRKRGNALQWQPGDASPVSIAREPSVSIRRAGRVVLPGWGGALRARRVREGGVPLAWLAKLDLRERSGGERFQAGPGRPPRSLKKQFQAAEVAAWQRHGPLVYSGGLLVFVPGLGLDARVVGLPGQPLFELDWEPLPPG